MFDKPLTDRVVTDEGVYTASGMHLKPADPQRVATLISEAAGNGISRMNMRRYGPLAVTVVRGRDLDWTLKPSLSDKSLHIGGGRLGLLFRLR